MRTVLLSVALLGVAFFPGRGHAQQPGPAELEERIESAPGSTVRFTFGARPGVCGNGTGLRIPSDRVGKRRADWCRPGPVRVVLHRSASGRIHRLDFRVGGASEVAEAEADLGHLPARSSGLWLLELAGRAGSEVGTDAVQAAVLADSLTAWPHLLSLARDGTRPDDVRTAATFWVSQVAADSAEGRVSGALTRLTASAREDLELRKQAVFALAQRPRDEAVPTLLSLARKELPPELTRTIFFWLAQSEDPRALAYFEEILLGAPQ